MSVTDVDQEITSTGRTFHDLVRRLSHQSVVKHFDAYADIDWDSEAFAIDPDDPRWELGENDPLARTEWYRSQPPGVRARIGLHTMAAKMKIGLQFENILKRGLLEYTFNLRNGDPEFRYAYHEVIEEAQHGLMFQEFVNRSGLRIHGLPKPIKAASRLVVGMGRRFPEMFFIFVLGGEDPIDHVQRETLRSDREIHPLLERIMRIHVTEEARHLSFARHLLKQRVPQLPWWKRQALAVQAPVTLGIMASLMLQPSPQVIRTYNVPREVVRAAYGNNPEARQTVRDSLRKVRQLCVELGLVTPASKRIWTAFGIWDEPSR